MSRKIVQLRVTWLRPTLCILLCGLLFPSTSDISESLRVGEDCTALRSWISAEEQAEAQLHGFKASVSLLKKTVYDSGPDKVSSAVAAAVVTRVLACMLFLLVWVVQLNTHFRGHFGKAVFDNIMPAMCDVNRLV